MSLRPALLAIFILVMAGAAQAQSDGCEFNRQIYPEGSEMCQSGTLVRCEEGSWDDIGLCDEDTPAPPPRTGGGDVEVEGEVEDALPMP